MDLRIHLALSLLLALAAAGCPDREPPAHPAVRYEQEPFPPPDPRALAAGTTIATRADAGGADDDAAPGNAGTLAR